ncbi:MAG: bifunctional 23S rRNA (guanine(2069)-N(7))-methyltransferase RlmK/23S rRNA (guanine(2445)-N(2))-methyltransferase RlmL [Pseudomonadales bacterium]
MPDTTAVMAFFATCPRYMEELLADEIRDCGAEDVRLGIGGVNFTATLEQAYQLCLWSRLGNRVLLELDQGRIDSRDELYALASAVDWKSHVNVGGSILVDFTGSSHAIRNTQFGAQVVKDAVVDQFHNNQRPNIDKRMPDVRINAHLAKGQLTLSIDLSGESLHRRHYREGGGEAPLKENLAAAIVMRSRWSKIVRSECAKPVMVDPMCGSGTLLIEAALMAFDIAPGLRRTLWGFSGWKQHQPAIWQTLLSDAEQRRTAGLENTRAHFYGFDQDRNILEMARRSVNELGLEQLVTLQQQSVSDMTSVAAEPGCGLLLCNPPYGERLGELRELENLYATLGGHLKQYFAGWSAAVFSSNIELLDELRLRSDKKYRFRNGPLDAQLRLFDIATPNQTAAPVKTLEPLRLARAKSAPELVNRLRKNHQRLQKALKSRDTNCYRLYDADIPEYASAIDVYADHAVVSEYVAPETVPESLAKQRFDSTMASVAEVLALPGERVIAKRKVRQKGKTQYQRTGRGSELLQVFEGSAQLLVNLHDYHDTGLFLDHRPVRRLLAERARGKRFLNLFCYTAAATVHAALGGASSSISVDMSAPYIAWARKNLILNKLNVYDHTLVQADCLTWLADCDERFDLILLDPPSFSNSKRMESVLDVQRDHVQLIEQCVALLEPGGELVFSTNKRKFRLDSEALTELQVQDITKRTLDADFQRATPAHQCWLITTD